MTSRPTPGLTWLNTTEEGAVRTALTEVCTSGAWVSRMLTWRPYADAAALFTASDVAMAELDAEDLAEAMAGHPPIGRPEKGDLVSTGEQRGMADASEELKAQMLELNLEYQEKFGHVFLICATGLTGDRMRDAVRTRLGNAPERERENVRNELVKINRIRLTRLAHEGDDKR